MSIATNLGYPRLGRQRELKAALEKYWAGQLSSGELLEVAARIRLEHWKVQKQCGIGLLPSNDFSLYDHVLDTSWMVGAIPERFQPLQGKLSDLDVYFAMARGWQGGEGQAGAMEMTKWFDTNYHFIVPEIAPGQKFHLRDAKPVSEFVEAKEAGFVTRPVLLGPVSYLLLSKSPDHTFRPLWALPELLPVYGEVLRQLAAAGAEWVQLDEPCLAVDLDEAARQAYVEAYAQLHDVPGISVMLTTYFGGLGDNLPLAANLPVAGVHLDLVRAPEQLELALATLPPQKVISLGLVDGRNVWRTPFERAVGLVRRAVATRGSGALQIAPGCSLLFCPEDLDLETELDPEIRSWLAFAKQKLEEVAVLNAVANGDEHSVADALAHNRQVLQGRRSSAQVVDPQVRQKLGRVDDSQLTRHSPFEQRRRLQASQLNLPLLPTTTIGSFPQTAEIRKQRALFNQAKLSKEEYDLYLKQQIRHVIEVQETLGLDVLVHGEFERTDMVEYFAEQLKGFAFTQHGWVQSYGSRAVRPPIIYGDVSRPGPMTVEWSTYAQSLTARPVKGMLTGPVTIVQWSFVRDDQPLEVTCKQIALALRDEVHDLEAAGLKIIQIDEPALREGLPLRKAQWQAYLDWAVDCFRLAAGVARDETQVHTHMCYAEFDDIIAAIARMDADVISIEASRSKMELLETFGRFRYPNDMGPGIYDIHSPRVPSTEEVADLIHKALKVVPAGRLWVNPDCGLKTRRWEEVMPALDHVAAAAKQIRREIEATSESE